MAVTGRDGIARTEAPLGKSTVIVGGKEEEAWVGVDQETFVEIEC
jgi:hypothetical protein